LKEIGSAIDGDIKREELLPYMKDYIKEKYSIVFTFEEAEKIYNTLMNVENEISITKLWLSIENESPYLVIAKDKLKNLEELCDKGDLKEIFTMDEKIDRNSYFKSIVEEIIVSLYKLAMKKYKEGC
jgi:hypothetical protein